MTFVDYINFGEFAPYREMFIQAGGVEKRFLEGVDLWHYLKKRGQALYIDSGLAILGVLKHDGQINNGRCFAQGSIAPMAEFVPGFLLEDYLRLSPIRGGLSGIVFPVTELWRLKDEDKQFALLIERQLRTTLTHILFAPVLYRDGSGMNRVCNFLYHISLQKKMGPLSTLELTQDELASSTGLSRSQVARVLAKLRELGIVQTQYESIRIVNREALRAYVSDVVLELE